MTLVVIFKGYYIKFLPLYQNKERILHQTEYNLRKLLQVLLNNKKIIFEVNIERKKKGMHSINKKILGEIN